MRAVCDLVQYARLPAGRGGSHQEQHRLAHRQRDAAGHGELADVHETGRAVRVRREPHEAGVVGEGREAEGDIGAVQQPRHTRLAVQVRGYAHHSDTPAATVMRLSAPPPRLRLAQTRRDGGMDAR